jgi:DNA-binding response OmpR family regulator
MGGLATCRAIRSDTNIAIIMLTVRNSEEDKVAAIDAGADDFVTKPFSTPELLARIRAALRRLPNLAIIAVESSRRTDRHRLRIAHGIPWRISDTPDAERARSSPLFDSPSQPKHYPIASSCKACGALTTGIRLTT